jgi:phosphoribosylaminoimidazole-succinocarboxamide synthase
LKLIKKGKVKDIYEVDDKTLIFHFTDRVSAFDVIMNDTIPYKGRILCDFAIFWFSNLNIPNHFIKKIDVDKILVRKLSIIPIECIVRGYMYGSLYSRYKAGNYSQIPKELQPYLKDNKFAIADGLPLLLFDPSTKSDEHDIPINEEQLLTKKILNKEEYIKIKSLSIELYSKITKITKLSNFILADVKFEFGKDPLTDEIVLADSLGPDECRLWSLDDYEPGKLQDSFDKQILRDWLNKSGFIQTVDDFSKLGKKPDPPPLPTYIIDKISARYIEAYERITKTNFKKD